MRTVFVGESVYMQDPNDPECKREAIAGGLVIDVDTVLNPKDPSEFIDEYLTARNYHGKIVFTRVRSDQVHTHFSDVDRALASNVYRALAKEVGAQRTAKPSDLSKLRQALRVCEIWASTGV